MSNLGGATISGNRPALSGALGVNLAKSHLPSLDGLRAIAAFLVVFYHAGVGWSPGGLGVLTFFVLSGFLITWLLLKEEEQSGTISLKLFYIRRSLRIFPAFYAYWFLVSAALLLAHKRYIVAQAMSSFFYVNNYYQALHGDPNTAFSHTWSLGVEEQFYLLWPLFFLLLKHTRSRLRFLIAAIFTIALYREALVFVIHRNQGYIYDAFDTRADHLLIGCLLAVALRAGVWTKLWQRLCAAWWLTALSLGMLIISTALALQFGSTYRDAVGFVVDPLLVAVLIVQCIAHPTAGFGIALNWRWMRYLGTISYSVYLYQQIVLDPVGKRMAAWPLLTLPVSILTVIAMASASYWIVERPFLRLKKRFESDRKVPLRNG
ncbi:MAG TPA: acyltransferase [Bryobacteraceae bacterium]|nr:acyltransferase [Bryobacteraceae bacterium]